MIIDANFSEQSFLPVCLEDWIAQDHPARLIRDFVEGLDMARLGFKMRKSKEGAPSYAPQLLLRLWLMGYFHQVRSARKMEAMTREMIGAIWLAGNHRPDHNTLWRFWRDNMDAISALYREIIRLAVLNKQVGFVLHAVDGTLVQAASSNRTALHKKDIDKALAKLDEVIESMEQQLSESGDDSSAAPSGYELEGELKNARQRREKLSDKLKVLEEENEQRALHPLEKDVKLLNKVGWGWNCQAVADETCGLVVAAEVTSQANDNRQLCPMLEAAKANTGGQPQVTVGDTGYGRSHEELMHAQQAGHNVVVGLMPKEKEPYTTTNFIVQHTDDGTSFVVCPQGQHLPHVGSTAWQFGEGQMRKFRCKVHEQCPAVAQCMANRASRCIHISPAHQAAVDHKTKVTPEQRKKLMTRRRQLVERCFGQLKQNMNFRRFSYRGQKAATAQWHMLWLVENLKTLWKRMTPDALKRPIAT